MPAATVTDSTPAQVLATPMGENDAGAATVRDYLIRLLRGVWTEGEGFNSKRPFGNSGWDSEIHTALARAGMVGHEFDSDGYLEDVDSDGADALVLAAIESLS